MEGYAKTHLRFNVAIENSRGTITICTATEKYRAHYAFFYKNSFIFKRILNSINHQMSSISKYFFLLLAVFRVAVFLQLRLLSVKVWFYALSTHAMIKADRPQTIS